MGEEAAFLRDVADVAALGGLVVLVVVDDFATDGDGPPVRSLEAGQDAEEGGLPASGGTEHGRDGSGRHLEIEPLEHRLWSETLVQTGNDQVGGGRCHAGLVAWVGQAVEVAPEEVAGQGGHGDDHQGEGSGLSIGKVLLVGPELRRQGLYAGGDEDERSRELGHGGQEDQAERGGQSGTDQREGDPDEDSHPALPQGPGRFFQTDRGVGHRGPDARPEPAGRRGWRRR